MHKDVKKILFSEEQILARAKELGAQISADYAGRTPLLICILRGASIFFAELVKNITIDCNLDFMCLTSYDGTCSTGEIRTLLDVRGSVAGRDVIIVEDIVDTGLTLNTIKKNFEARGVNTFEICAMLDKPENRKVPISAKYIGFAIKNEFVIGFGLDYNERYRNLPYIGVYNEEKK